MVARSLRVKKMGNAVVAMLGGRSVHPVGACVGGFYSAPTAKQAADLLPEVKACRDEMCDLTLWLARTVKFPELESDYEFVSLCPRRRVPDEPGPDRQQQGAARVAGGVRRGDRGAAGAALDGPALALRGPRLLSSSARWPG